jgi:flavin reductase (DIM6/NTAB) family NADH-FMN oxidoreductase RutF
MTFEPQTDLSETLRAAFRRHASGVAVITTTNADGAPVGFTATSMTSLGSNPPLLTFNVACGSSSWAAVSQAKAFAVHTLGARNLELARRMAADSTQRFVPNDWGMVAALEGVSVPVFDAATAVLICKAREIHNVENNAIVVVEVIDGGVGQIDDALLYNQRGYLTPGNKLD